MAVNIDTVYQQVLAISNKEQRGYITPQEFNLMANKAQLEIFEGYFHDLKTAYHKRKNDMVYADETEMIMDKLQFFDDVAKDGQASSFVVSGEQNETNVTNGISSTNLNYNQISIGRLSISDSSVYRIKSVERDNTKVEEVDQRDLLDILNNPLTTPTKSRSIYVRERHNGNRVIQVYPKPVETSAGIYDTSSFTVRIWKKPAAVQWAYVVVNNKALYNSSLANHFELHPSEEQALVTRILQLSGVVMDKSELTQTAMVDAAQNKQSQND